MLSNILYRQEHELLHKIAREKSFLRKLVLAVKIEAISAAYADTVANNE